MSEQIPDNTGWIRLHRKMQQNSLWKERREFSKAEAWVDILMEARHSEEPAEIIIGMHTITCNRGECIKSLDTWAIRWNWHKSKVRRVLRLFQDMNMIRLKSETQTTRISVCNYDTYNPLRNADETQLKRKRNATETHATPNKNVKNGENEKNDTHIGGGVPTPILEISETAKDIANKEWMQCWKSIRERHPSPTQIPQAALWIQRTLDQGVPEVDIRDALAWLPTAHGKQGVPRLKSPDQSTVEFIDSVIDAWKRLKERGEL